MGYNTISLAIIVVSKTLESYSRGRRGGPAKALVRETVARVRIPDSPPRESHTKHLEISVSYFFLHDCFGMVIPLKSQNRKSITSQLLASKKR